MPSTVTLAAVAIELVLVLAGLGLLWRFYLSPQGRRTAPALRTWDVTAIDFMLFCWFAVSGAFIGQLIAAVVPYVRELADSNQKGVLISGGTHLGAIAGAGVFALRHRFSPNAPGAHNIFVSGLATFLISLPVIFLVGSVSQLLLKALGVPMEKQLAIDIFSATTSPWWRLIFIVVAVILAPMAEELVFRAGFFRFVRTRLPRWAALALPACVFAAMHLHLPSFAQLATLGIVFSLAYERTGKIGTAIVAHALFNLHTVLFLIAGVEV